MIVDDEFPVVFGCSGEQLLGIVHRGNPEATVGIVVVVGGPQYRVGSHRQFVLMARQLAAAGIPVFRFDCRGMGDSSGGKRTFEEVDQDFRVAIDLFMDKLRNIKQVVLMALCDGASATMMYGQSDRRVTGMILMNPWTRTGDKSSTVRLRHYYLPRLMQKSFWRKMSSGEFTPIRSMRGLAGSIREAISLRKHGLVAGRIAGGRFVEQMLFGLERFKHPVLMLLSGRDLVAHEFLELRSADKRWKRAMQGARIDIREMADADHTLSSRKDLDLAVSHCLEWHQKLLADEHQRNKSELQSL